MTVYPHWPSTTIETIKCWAAQALALIPKFIPKDEHGPLCVQREGEGLIQKVGMMCEDRSLGLVKTTNGCDTR
jgi:hypothetical protein